MKSGKPLLNKYELVKIEDLVGYARNARTHSPEQVAQIAASIREFGFLNPVLIDKECGIIAGHGRVLAAQKLALKEVPCLRVEHLTETQKRAYILADNKLALNSGWDNDLLQVELAELKEENFDALLTGFSESEIKLMLNGHVFEPDLPPDDEPDSKPGALVLRVEFDNDDERQLLFFELRDRGLKVKV